MTSFHNSKMACGLFSFSTPFDFSGIQGSYNLQDYEKEAAVIKGKEDHLFGVQEIGEDRDYDPLCPEYGLYDQENVAKKPVDQGEQQQQLGQATKLDYLDEFDFSSAFSTTLAFQEFPRQENIQELVKPIKEIPSSLYLSSLELLSSYGNSFKKLKMGKSSGTGNETNARGHKKLSTEEIMRVAGARYVQFSDQRYDDFSMVMHPFGHALSGLSADETKDVELVHLLLAAAEKVGYEQFERASRLLSRCEWIASERANPVQRVVYNFAEALRERIDKGTGRIISNELEAKVKNEIDHGLGTNVTSVSVHQYIPFVQVMQFTGIQAIIENVASASKIHVIDLQIRSGVQWTGLMQALAEREQRRVELLKITAVELVGNQKIEESGKRLESVAASLNLPFSFRVTYVDDMKDIKEELFKIGSDESLAVYCPLVLRTLVWRPSCLENLMRVIKNLNPVIMVVIEVEANHNSPSFGSRFIEALFFYSAFFECIDTCLAHDVELRTKTESVFYNGIRSIVAMEGDERIARSVKMEVWSAFFARFRMVELGFSDSSLYQANLVIKRFPCASSCTLDRIGKSLIVGWKGTPVHSVSAWKFSRDRGRAFAKYRF
ncbi:PREDICTED: DELLA protein RGL1 [Theobroma cacao]|uniref:DELLA protein RGL1 n=1 Tax=Theobroma cacao TaxID=3641 RepID=A0AB32WGI2_THECC|nr:PREDICTED: DELLA protein RGL1 [Theobroma cacao]